MRRAHVTSFAADPDVNDFLEKNVKNRTEFINQVIRKEIARRRTPILAYKELDYKRRKLGKGISFLTSQMELIQKECALTDEQINEANNDVSKQTILDDLTKEYNEEDLK